MDLAAYRRSTNGHPAPSTDRLPRHNAGRRFLKGPIPIDWLSQAAKLRGRSFHVGLAAWYLAGLTKSRRVKLTSQALKMFGVGRRQTCYLGMDRLAAAGLITVNRKSGRAPVVTIMAPPSEESTGAVR